MNITFRGPGFHQHATRLGIFSLALFFVASQRYDTPPNRFQYSRDRPTDAQLAADFIQRAVNSPLRHTKPVRDLPNLVPVSEQPQEINLATGELIVKSSPVSVEKLP